jgi:hypothetical protein
MTYFICTDLTLTFVTTKSYCKEVDNNGLYCTIVFKLTFGYDLKGCLKGILRTKTVFLVTHQVDLLQNVDNIIVSFMFYLSEFTL